MVFKKFTDRLVSAGTTVANTLLHGPEQAEKIRQLESMGFPTERARHALDATGGDVDRAAELLLLGANEPQQHHHHQQQSAPPPARAAMSSSPARNNNRQNAGPAVAAQNDEQMRRAIDESMWVSQQEEARQLRQAEAASMKNNRKKKEVIDLTGDKKTTGTKKNKTNNPPKNTVKSAAAINAGNAAASRTNNNNHNKFAAQKNTLDQTHPNVRLPERLSNKTKEEQILRCANRVKPHVMAVDTLLRVLTSVRNMPDNAKFRIIDRTNGNYITFVRDTPGAEDMLLAMNYRMISCNNELRLERHMVDEALLYLGISALEQMRMTDEYKEGKRLRGFHAEMRRVAKGNGSPDVQRGGMTEGETAIRLGFLSKCPKEPPEGRGAWVNVQLGDVSENIVGGSVKRRFDGDDTLEDVLNWLGGSYGNEVLDKIRGTRREWCLCDLNRFPILPLDVEKHGKKTLQYLGLFPSGKLGVRLSDDAWRDRKEGSDTSGGFGIHGSARGLGAASRSMLH
mmetsp:Transcript_18924/g.34095  ORF Transcript_18924/g.34095 Transcript_18924/m.34095 type:complete len:510 (+) Transcript_18924:166-1695(+)|eukprot:CAMPEP_0201657162 /NCGR_PEP_ID=MMETSP0494-20130426/493_1 /ASSEMBLY_ACC=CAM_ASM_000839 /TAXON_ID=420259 /ORGANISM="Thalassiosira gravida, Strain GMp14c1" /LENGTH=509 /DNA_ID=CAMNT_0048133939 /DNA_START=233 /DNA_END=1762 /DNA_ORIENTATION=+